MMIQLTQVEEDMLKETIEVGLKKTSSATRLDGVDELFSYCIAGKHGVATDMIREDRTIGDTQT